LLLYRKIPWRLSRFQKLRQRRRLRAVDDVVATVDAALAKKGETLKALERWKEEMPTEAEMLPKDKYTLFDRKAKKYRKGIHSTLMLRNIVNSRICLANSGLCQNCPSGLVCPRESTPPVTKARRRSQLFAHVYRLYNTNITEWTFGVFVMGKHMNLQRNMSSGLETG